MRKSDKLIFNVLKSKITTEAARHRRRPASHIASSEVGSEATFAVVDSFETQIPGSLFGSSSPETITIQSDSIVDNRNCTKDIIRFTRDSRPYEATEYFDSPDRVKYSLRTVDGKTIDGIQIGSRPGRW